PAMAPPLGLAGILHPLSQNRRAGKDLSLGVAASRRHELTAPLQSLPEDFSRVKQQNAGRNLHYPAVKLDLIVISAKSTYYTEATESPPPLRGEREKTCKFQEMISY